MVTGSSCLPKEGSKIGILAEMEIGIVRPWQTFDGQSRALGKLTAA